MDIKEIVINSYSIRECLIKLNWNITGSNHKLLKKIIQDEGIDISHFDPHRNNNIKEKKQLVDVLIINSVFNRTHLKERLYKEGLKTRECELCGQGEMWMGKKMSLILDHINGVNNDNRLENLRIVCPNCNATLETHCGRNTKNSIFNKNKEKTCSCGNLIRSESDSCKKCSSIKIRKVKERPSYDTLRKDVSTLGYVKTGKKYGVSDNAIRKWLKVIPVGIEPTPN